MAQNQNAGTLNGPKSEQKGIPLWSKARKLEANGPKAKKRLPRRASNQKRIRRMANHKQLIPVRVQY